MTNKKAELEQALQALLTEQTEEAKNEFQRLFKQYVRQYLSGLHQ